MILTTHLLAAVPHGELGAAIDMLAARADLTGIALDMLVTGF